MRSDALYLQDIVEASDAIGRFIAGITFQEFLANELIRSAVLQKLTVIGEAAASISDPLRARHTEVPWSDVIGFRNFVVHAYFRVDWAMIWSTATTDVPHLRIQISQVIDTGEVQ